MATEITKLLKEATQGILTDATLDQIQSAFDSAVNERVKIHVEKALTEQDSEYTEKAQELLESIDKSHSEKLLKVVEALDQNNVQKLKMVIDKYQGIIGEQARTFKSDLVEKISDYIDVFIESKIPKKSINEAVKNQKAKIILSKLRESLAIDSALMKDSLKGAILDGHDQLRKAKESEQKALTESTKLRESLEQTKAALILEQKTATLSPKKKQYAQRVFEGKSPKFIMENLDYTLSLFDKKEEERLKTLKEEAFTQRSVQQDRVVIEENVEESSSFEQQTENNFGYVKNYMS